jgi:hypothetical protein
VQNTCGCFGNTCTVLVICVLVFTVFLYCFIYVRRWADKFCLHCNIFIYIRHIWIKPVLCSRMVSLFHHTSPWTHICLQFSPSVHRNGRDLIRSVQTACCYWILNRGKSSSNWKSQTNASRLGWSVCWCEYSKMLGKAVQRWRIGVSRFEWQNTKDGFQKLVQRLRKCIEMRRDFVEK